MDATIFPQTAFPLPSMATTAYPPAQLTAGVFPAFLHTPDWQDHLMHVMTYVWSFPPPHIFSPIVIEVVKAEYPAGQL